MEFRLIDSRKKHGLLISAQSVSKSFGVAPLFTDVSFSVYEGDKLGLIGPNGSGKSTLLKIVMGIETPDSGKVAQNRRAHLVYLPQEDPFDVKDHSNIIIWRPASIE